MRLAFGRFFDYVDKSKRAIVIVQRTYCFLDAERPCGRRLPMVAMPVGAVAANQRGDLGCRPFLMKNDACRCAGASALGRCEG